MDWLQLTIAVACRSLLPGTPCAAAASDCGLIRSPTFLTVTKREFGKFENFPGHRHIMLADAFFVGFGRPATNSVL